MKISGIYQIQSKIKPERIYIGSSNNIGSRWRGHLNDLKNNKHGNSKLQNHYNKYGECDLQFSILLGCDNEYLIANEQFFIDSYKPYFNIRQLADSNLGIKRSEETKRKLSKAKKGYVPWNKGKKMNFSPEQKEKFRLAHCGKTNGIPLSEERKIKISIANKGKQNCLGRKLSDETKKKIGNANKGKVHTEEQNKRHNEQLRGVKQTPEHNLKVSLARKGIKLSEDHKQHIRESWILRKLNKVQQN